MKRAEQVKQLVAGYAFNTMEICRLLNGRDPKAFKGCYYEFNLTGRHPRCRYKERGCRVISGSVDCSLRRMQSQGKIRSIKLRWFDGRAEGAYKDSIQLDVFRFYFFTKPDLAQKMRDDIDKHLGGVPN